MPLSCDNIDSIDDLPQQLSNRVYSRFYSVLPNLPVTLRKLETVPEESSARDFEQPKMDRTAKLPNGTEMRGSVNLTRINREYATGGFNGYPKPLETSSPVVRNHSNDSVNNLLRDSSEDVRAENDAFMTVEDEPDEVFIKSPGKLQSKLFGIFSGRKQSRNVSDTASVNSEQSVTRVRTDLGNSKGDRPKLGRNFFKRNSRNMEPSDNLSLQFDNSGGQKLLAGGNRRSFDDSDAGFNSSTEMSRNSARLSFRTAPTNTVWTGRTAMSRQDKSEFRPPEPVRLYRQVDTQPVPPEARTISPINRHTPFSYTHGLDELVTQQKSLSPASARRVFTNTTPAEKSKPPARPPPPEIVKKSVRFDTNFAPPQPPLRSKSKVVTFESSVFPPKRSDSLELIDSHAVGHILSGYTVNEEEENLLDEGKKKGSKGQKNTVV